MQEDGIVRKLYKADMLNVEQEFVKDVHYEVITGSAAYGMRDTAVGGSNTDVVAICIPPVDYVFPYISGGHILGFGPKPQNFEVFQQHHIMHTDKEYDIAVYGIVKFFQLAAENNPNMVDILFVKDHHITHIDNIGRLIKQNRKLFLTRHAFHKFSGYAYAQLKKMRTMNKKESRAELIEAHGYDTKYGSHLARLALECEQILIEHDLDLERHSELLKSIRRGEWTLEQLELWFKEKELTLNRLYTESTLRYGPDWPELMRVLLCCLEEKFGSLDKYVNISGDSRILRKYEQIVQIINS